MKSLLVLISVTTAICHGILTSSDEETTRDNRKEPKKSVNQQTAEDFTVGIMPIKILLDFQLRTQNVPEYKLQHSEAQDGSKKEKSVSFPDIPKTENKVNDCSDLNLMKNLTLTEISNIINNNFGVDENSVNKEQLEKIYNSLKDCFYWKARNAKLWGPLWHCLNRLFLFFVFN